MTVPYDAMLFEERDPATRNVGNTGYYPGGVYRYTKTFARPGASGATAPSRSSSKASTTAPRSS